MLLFVAGKLFIVIMLTCCMQVNIALHKNVVIASVSPIDIMSYNLFFIKSFTQ